MYSYVYSSNKSALMVYFKLLTSLYFFLAFERNFEIKVRVLISLNLYEDRNTYYPFNYY